MAGLASRSLLVDPGTAEEVVLAPAHTQVGEDAGGLLVGDEYCEGDVVRQFGDRLDALLQETKSAAFTRTREWVVAERSGSVPGVLGFTVRSRAMLPIKTSSVKKSLPRVQ